jgi:hypothetical protein
MNDAATRMAAALCLVACGPATYTTNGVPGAQPWTPGSIAVAIVMVVLFVGAPIALIVSSMKTKRKKNR